MVGRLPVPGVSSPPFCDGVDIPVTSSAGGMDEEAGDISSGSALTCVGVSGIAALGFDGVVEVEDNNL